MRGHTHAFIGSFLGFTDSKAYERGYSAFAPAPSTLERIIMARCLQFTDDPGQLKNTITYL